MQRSPKRKKRPPARVCGCGCGQLLNGSNRTVRKRYYSTAHRVRHYRQGLRRQEDIKPLVVIH